MRRTILGFLAAALLGTGILFWTMGLASRSPGLVGGLVRMGVVVAAIWIAIPAIEALTSKIPRWLGIAIGVGVVLVAMIPGSQLLALLIPLGIAAFSYKSWLPIVIRMVTGKTAVSVTKTRDRRESKGRPSQKAQPANDDRVVEGEAKVVPAPNKEPAEPKVKAKAQPQSSGPKRRARPAHDE